MKYALLLNDMRQPNCENIQIVKLADDPQKLKDWYWEQRCTLWKDGKWGKSFMPGSELEWFNQEDAGLEEMNNFYGGIWQVSDDAQIGMGLRKSEPGRWGFFMTETQEHEN